MSGFRDRIKPRMQDWMMGFELLEMKRFRHKGPSVAAQMVRGVAARSDTAGT